MTKRILLSIIAPCIKENPRQFCILASTPWILDSRYLIPDSLSVELGCQIPIVILKGILNHELYSGFQSPGSGFHKQEFPRLRILQAQIFRIPKSGFPYIGRLSGSLRCHYGNDSENVTKTIALRLGKRQICTCITLFCTYLCRHSTTTT